MSKTMMVAVIVLSTIECLLKDQKVTLLPSDQPQKLPKADAEEAIERGLAKAIDKAAPAKRPSKPKDKTGLSGEGGDEAKTDSDDEGNQSVSTD